MDELQYLRERMLNDIVLFAYEKSDGSRREAYGTLNTDIINEEMSKRPPAKHPRKQYRAANDNTFPYFDTEKCDWRCFVKDRFLEINDDFGL